MGAVRMVAKALLPRKYHYNAELFYLFMVDSTTFHERSDRGELMRKAFRLISFNEISGDYLEFGCCGAGTFRQAFSESRKHKLNRQLWAFDSFEGLPPQAVPADEHPKWLPGQMKTSLDDFHEICRRHGMSRLDYQVVPGYYDQTIGDQNKDADNLPRDIAFAYIDCDLFSSTKTVLEFLSSRLKHGMLIAFDDYYCFSGSQLSGERRAALEFLSRNSRFLFSPYLPFGWHGMSFIVEDRRLLKDFNLTVLP